MMGTISLSTSVFSLSIFNHLAKHYNIIVLKNCIYIIFQEQDHSYYWNCSYKQFSFNRALPVEQIAIFISGECFAKVFW